MAAGIPASVVAIRVPQSNEANETFTAAVRDATTWWQSHGVPDLPDTPSRPSRDMWCPRYIGPSQEEHVIAAYCHWMLPEDHVPDVILYNPKLLAQIWSSFQSDNALAVQMDAAHEVGHSVDRDIDESRAYGDDNEELEWGEVPGEMVADCFMGAYMRGQGVTEE